MRSIVTFGFVVAVVLGPGIHAASAQPTESRWTVQVSGVIQGNLERFRNWYTVPPTNSPTIGWESAVNGIRESSVGVDVAAERRATKRLGLGIAVGFIPTKLEASVHRSTENGIVMAMPEASIAYVPVRLTADYDILHLARWSIRGGGYVGMAVVGTTDVRPEFGRARHFPRGSHPLYGAQAGVVYSNPNGWGFGVLVHRSVSSFRVAELSTGNLAQTVDLHTWSLLLGVRRSFGRRR